jgi:hypothetical protein
MKYVKLFESWLNEEEESQDNPVQDFINSLDSMKFSDLKVMGIEKFGKKLANLLDYLNLGKKNEGVRFNKSENELENINSNKVFSDEIIKVTLKNIQGDENKYNRITDFIEATVENRNLVKDSDPLTDIKMINLNGQGGVIIISLGQLLAGIVRGYVSGSTMWFTDLGGSNNTESWNEYYAVLTGKDKAKSQILADKINQRVGDVSPKSSKSSGEEQR